jgi:hypothetical protein
LKHLSKQLQQIILEYYTPLKRIGEAEFAGKKNLQSGVK